jgi:SAM-dependent methyltransferase
MSFQDRDHPIYSGKSQLEMIENSLPKYNQNIIKLITVNYFKIENKNPKVLDFGAGQGSLASLILAQVGISPVCLELDPLLIKDLKEKNFPTIMSLAGQEGIFDFVYSSNVLEHIEDDLGSLRQIYNSMKKDGELAVYVPAFQILFSGLDKEVGHVRRYSKSDLVKKVGSAGFTITEVKYVDSLGFPASLIMKVIGYNSKNGIGSKTSLNLYDKFIFPISLSLDNLFFSKIIGKNIFIRAIKET